MELGGCGRRIGAGGGNDDAAFGARCDVEMVGVAAGLRDEFQLRESFDYRARERRTLLGEHYRIKVAQPRREAVRILDRIAKYSHRVCVETFKIRNVAKCVR